MSGKTENPGAEGATEDLLRENEDLRARLREAEETLDAIRNGEVDAVVVGGLEGQQVYTLQNADRPYRVLIEQMQEGAVTLAGDGTVLYCNRKLASILRAPQERVIGGRFSDFVLRDDRTGFDRLLTESAAGGAKGEFTVVAADGTVVPVYLSFIDLPTEHTRLLCGVVTDLTLQKQRTTELAEANGRLRDEISEREIAEAQLRQAQKMEAVGQLTGGLAHDFNNLLTAIIGNIEILQRRLSVGRTDVEQFADGAMNGAVLAAGLTQRLLAFSRQQDLQATVLCVNDLLPDLEMLVRRVTGVDIEIQITKAEDLWFCRIDANQLESALLNLAINARDAMPNGGRLTISAANAILDETAAGTIPEATPGSYVAVTVSDTGTGIAPDVLPRVFEPFFTTKSVGKGSGLGLSQVYGFVRQSNGFVTINSVVDEKTEVRLYLPKVEAPPAVGARHRSADGGAPSTAPEPRCVVLVVEDDPNVRTIVTQLIRDMGYVVLLAENGPDALAVFDREPRIDLLFTDVVMPEGMSGIDLARTIRRTRPDIAVLLTSGFSPQSTAHDPAVGAEFQMVRKPYRQDDLAKAMRVALDQRPESPTPKGRRHAAERTLLKRQAARILLVEDEVLVAMMAEQTLSDLGYEVVGPASRLADALAMAQREQLDGALLDVNLHGQRVYPVADALAARDVPFAFMTGHEASVHPEQYRARPSLLKPYRTEDLERTVAALLPCAADQGAIQ